MRAPPLDMATKPRRANLKPPGKCVFCERGGLTKEHMWAGWLRNYIDRTMEEHRIGSTLIFPANREEFIERHTGDPHSRKIRCVCRECNNGWMSQVQTSVKPFLVPMLIGQGIGLHRNGQTTVAAWASTMVMVAEFLDRGKIAIPQVDRAFLYEKRRPPSHWRIWVGRHRRKLHPLYTHNILPFVSKEEFERIPRGTMGEANTQTSTICLGEHLIIHVMSSRVARSIVRRWSLPPIIDLRMAQIWPVRRSLVMWPPSGAPLDDIEIDLLAQQFLSRVETVARRAGIIC